MSVKTFFRFRNIVFLLFGLALGAGIRSYQTLLTPKFSVSASKWQKLTERSVASAVGVHSAKPTNHFQLELRPASQGEIKPGDIFELTGTTNPQMDLGAVTFKWVLGEGVEYVGGNLESSFNSASAGVPLSTSIKLKRRGTAPGFAHLEVSTLSGGTKMGSVASFSTEDVGPKATVQRDMQLKQMELLKAEGFRPKLIQ